MGWREEQECAEWAADESGEEGYAKREWETRFGMPEKVDECSCF